MRRIKCTFYLNTNAGIGANLPIHEWFSGDNHYNVIEHRNCVTIEVDAELDVFFKWIFNLAKDGRYKIIGQSEFLENGN